MNHITAVVAGLSLAFAGTSTAWADPTCEPDGINMIELEESWFHWYNSSTFMQHEGCDIGAPRAQTTYQGPDAAAGVWDKLISFPESTAFDILELEFKDIGGGKPTLHHIENPVLVVTIDTNDWSEFLPFRSTDPDYLDQWVYRPVRVENTGILPTPWATPWFGAHMVESVSENGTVTYHKGTALGYLDQVLNVDRACFNPTTDQDPNYYAAIAAASAAPPGVGMPWTFNGPLGFPAPDHPLPWEGGNASWWQQRYLVFIADRDAFVRPSFNPSMRADEPSLHTNNGIPPWQDWEGDPCAEGFYYYPEDPAGPGHDLNPAFLKATENFYGMLGQPTDDGLPGDPNNGGVRFYSQTEGFLLYMEEWKHESWDPPANSPPNWDWAESRQAVGFPFSGLGLTLNWTAFQEYKQPGDLSTPFGATSEFIHATWGKPIFLVGILDPYQYLGAAMPGQVPWCDTCIGDFNRDGFVDVSDLLAMLQHWDPEPEEHGDNWPLQYNIDTSSEMIDVQDLLELLNLWGQCEWPLDWRPEDCLPVPN